MIDLPTPVETRQSKGTRPNLFNAEVSPEDQRRAELLIGKMRHSLQTHQYERARAAINAAEREYQLAIQSRVKRARPLDTPLIAAGVEVREANRLEEYGIYTVEDVLSCTDEYLIAIPNFGEKSLAHVKQVASDWIGRTHARAGA